MNETCPNYFIEIEERFRCARGTPLFRLSPLDWALVEAWKNGGIPLEAVLRGIDIAFERWRRRPAQARIELVNGLAYCSQAVATEAQSLINAARGVHGGSQNPLSIEQIRGFITKNATPVRNAGHLDIAEALEAIDVDILYSDLERIEQHLTELEEKMIAKLRAKASVALLEEIRRSLEQELEPYRNKMSTEQLDMLERKFLERRLLNSAGLPRLSLFYLE